MLVTLINNILISFLFACWGSFLNVIAYRLLYNKPFWTPRSHCTSCNSIITWYDLIPLLSWLLLRGKCRQCSATISWLYFLIEVCALIIFWGIFIFIKPVYQFAYFILFSSLLITVRTDLEEMIILRIFSLGLIPLGLLLSSLGYLPITLAESFWGILGGYLMLFIPQIIYFRITREQGMGEGDPELLAGIGAFIGILACWKTLIAASFTGSFFSLFLFTRYGIAARKYPLPFGPLLAMGTFIIVLLW